MDMDKVDEAVATLTRYLRSKGYKLGRGKIFDAVTDTITNPNSDPEAVKALDKVMRDPLQAGAMIELMIRDLSGKTKRAPKRKVRRGVGSY